MFKTILTAAVLAVTAVGCAKDSDNNTQQAQDESVDMANDTTPPFALYSKGLKHSLEAGALFGKAEEKYNEFSIAGVIVNNRMFLYLSPRDVNPLINNYLHAYSLYSKAALEYLKLLAHTKTDINPSDKKSAQDELLRIAKVQETIASRVQKITNAKLEVYSEPYKRW